MAEDDAEWTVRIDRLQVALSVGVDNDERAPQPVLVSLVAHARTAREPCRLDDCFDYVPLLRWLRDEWPLSPHVELLETRLNEVAQHVYRLEPRVERVWVALQKMNLAGQSAGVSLERRTRRSEYGAPG